MTICRNIQSNATAGNARPGGDDFCVEVPAFRFLFVLRPAAQLKEPSDDEPDSRSDHPQKSETIKRFGFSAVAGNDSRSKHAQAYRAANCQRMSAVASGMIGAYHEKQLRETRKTLMAMLPEALGRRFSLSRRITLHYPVATRRVEPGHEPAWIGKNRLYAPPPSRASPANARRSQHRSSQT